MFRRITFVLVFVGLLLGGLARSTSGPGIVEAAAQHSTGQATSPQPPRPGMADMMKMHDDMMAEMKAADGRLDALVSDMNAATDAGKVDAMAAVVNELVRQQKAMHARMVRMHQQMMSARGMMMGR